MVGLGNSVATTFRYSNGIRQRRQLSLLLNNVHADDLNHYLQATGVGCYLVGAFVNTPSYADDLQGVHKVSLQFQKFIINATDDVFYLD